MDKILVRNEPQNTVDRLEVFEKEALPLREYLYKFALKITRNECKAQDLLQDTYLRAFKSFHSYSPGTNIKAWLFRIMKNRHINLEEKKSNKMGNLSLEDIKDYQYYQYVPDIYRTMISKSAEENAMEKFDNLYLIAILKKLPHKFRLPVFLADMWGMCYREISQITGCPLGTVRSRIYRGRRRLEKYLTREV